MCACVCVCACASPSCSVCVQIRRNQDNLFYYLLFLRITPLLPNWFVNVSSPIVGVPVQQFVLATFLGTAVPPRACAVAVCARVCALEFVGRGCASVSVSMCVCVCVCP